MILPKQSEFPFSWGWLMALGILLVSLGCLGLVSAVYLSVASVLIFGALLFLAGLFQGWYGLTNKRHEWSGRALYLLVAVLYLVLGAFLMWDPVSGTVSLTLLLTAFLFVLGFSRLLYAWKCWKHGWRWFMGFLGGLVNLMLGGLIIYGWPGTAVWVIGLFVAVEMMMAGWVSIMMAVTMRAIEKLGKEGSS